jgi:hypothetical protein
MVKKDTEAEHRKIREQLNASFALSGYLLEAHNEEAAILAAMKVSTEILGAEGSAFVPFNEWKQSMPALKYGQADLCNSPDWQKRLRAPATRHACRICEQKQAGSECVLAAGTSRRLERVLRQPALWRTGNWRDQLFLSRAARSKRRPAPIPGGDGAPDRPGPG